MLDENPNEVISRNYSLPSPEFQRGKYNIQLSTPPRSSNFIGRYNSGNKHLLTTPQHSSNHDSTTISPLNFDNRRYHSGNNYSSSTTESQINR